RVGKHALRRLPRLVPTDLMLVNQQAHQFGDGDGRMGVVKLNSEMARQFIERGSTLLAIDAEDVLQGTRSKEILLLEAQLFSLGRLVIGIEDLGDVLRDYFFQDGAVIVAHVERLEIERFCRLRLPQAEQVNGVDAIADYGRVKGSSTDNPIGDPADPIVPILFVTFRSAAELDVENDLRPRNLPRVSQAQPLVGQFHLPPIPQCLIEDSELVTNAVADAR